MGHRDIKSTLYYFHFVPEFFSTFTEKHKSLNLYYQRYPMKNKLDDSNYFWNIITDFLNNYLPNIRRTSTNTIETYRNCLNRFIDYLESEKNVKRKEICYQMFSKKNLKEYMVWMNKIKNLASKTCNLRLTAIHSLMEYGSSEFTDLMGIYVESTKIKGVKLSQNPI